MKMPIVMIVDDEAEIRGLIKIILERSDYEILEAGSAAAVREAMTGPQPDVILLDLNLPDAVGLTLLLEVRKKWRETNIIAVAGYGTTDLLMEARKLGASEFLFKPFDCNAVKFLVERALEPTGSIGPPIRDFKLLRCIGRGSYGDVWLARNQ